MTPISEVKTANYKKIKYEIVHAIHDKRWADGKAIPSETALSRRYGVSIGTVRKAIDELVSEGILVREQGRGTFVRSKTSNYMLDVFYRLEGHDGSRELPITKSFEIIQTIPTPQVASRLKLRGGESVFVIKKMLTKNDQPAIYDEISIPTKMFAHFSDQMLQKYQGTLYEIFQKEYGYTVVRIEETVEAELADPLMQKRLGLTEPEPLLRINRLAFLDEETPLETRTRHVRSILLRYFNTLGGW